MQGVWLTYEYTQLLDQWDSRNLSGDSLIGLSNFELNWTGSIFENSIISGQLTFRLIR